MHDQILLGVTAAIQGAAEGEGSTHLRNLTEGDAQILVAEVLRSLAETPVEAPVVAVMAPAPTFLISPAAVIAREARNSLSEVVNNETMDPHRDMVSTIEFTVGEDHREFREYLFAIQSLFGVRVRSLRSIDGARFFAVAGLWAQTQAFQRAALMIYDLAAPALDGMSRDEQREFWATLGMLSAAVDEAAHLVESNRGAYAAATGVLHDFYGPTRTLARADAARSGDLYDRALAVLGES